MSKLQDLRATVADSGDDALLGLVDEVIADLDLMLGRFTLLDDGQLAVVAVVDHGDEFHVTKDGETLPLSATDKAIFADAGAAMDWALEQAGWR